jgi:hypothetical protein
MVRRLDDDLVRTDAVHPIEQPVAFAIERPLDPERRELVGHDPDVPASRIAGSAVSVREDLGRGLVFVPFAERTQIVRPGDNRLDLEVARTLLPLGGNDDPSSGHRIFSQISHRSTDIPRLTLRTRTRAGRSRS